MSNQTCAKRAIIAPPSDGSHLATHDVIYRGPLPVWQSGIPLGNGDTCVVVYQQDAALRYGITRAGLADRRNPMQIEKTHAEIKALWEAGRFAELEAWDRRENAHYMQKPYPNPRPAGVLALIPPGADADEDSRHVLSLRHAELTQQTASADIETFVDKRHDCVCLRLRLHAPLDLAFSPVIDYPGKGKHWWDSSGDIDKEMRVTWAATPKGFVVDVAFPGGEAYTVACVCAGATLSAGKDAGRWTLTPAPAGKPVTLYLAVAASTDTPAYHAEAVKRAEQARADGFAAIRKVHRQDWQQFWAVNCLRIEDKFLEQLFYLGQYLLRGQHGGRHVYGSMNAWHLGTQPWHGDMHTNINVEMAWLPVFGLNRAELSNSFDSHFVSHLDDARRETRRFWGMPGVTYPFASVGNLNPLHGGFWRYEVYVTSWVAQIFWERYRFTGDRKYLQTVCYPILKEIMDFYEVFLQVDAEGRYFVPMVKPVESQRGPGGSPFVQDMLLDVVAVRRLLDAVIAASETLAADAGRCAKWRHMRDHLVPLPADKERRMFVAYRGADPNLPNDHPTLLGALFPSGLRLTPQELDYLENDFTHILNASKRGMDGFPFKKIFAWGDDLSYSWITIAAARLGKRELARAYLYDFLVLLQLKKNGLFASRPSDVVSRDGKVALINTTGGFMLALTELFLQSFDDVIRVFSATPPGFTAAFAGLKAAGNFTVDAAQSNGSLAYVRLVSGSGGVATIRNDWGRVVVTEPGGAVTVRAEKLITLPTVAGGEYLLTPAEPAEAFSREGKAKPRGEPRSWTGPCHLERVPPEQAWTITIGQ